MLNMDQYGSTNKKCDVHHIIGIKLQGTRTPRPRAAGAPDPERQRPPSNSESMKYPCPARVVLPGGGDLDSTVRALPPCPPWLRSKIFPKIRLVLVLTCLTVNHPRKNILKSSSRGLTYPTRLRYTEPVNKLLSSVALIASFTGTAERLANAPHLVRHAEWPLPDTASGLFDSVI